MIYRIAETTSTNDDAKRPEYRHGDIVWAERQTAGRGQRGHSWTSPEGENLTFTLVLEPVFLPVGEQFLLSEAVTLALTDTFAAFGIVTSSVCQALGHGVLSLIVSVLRQLVLILPSAWLLGHFVGLAATWLAFPFAEIFSFSLSCFFMFYMYRTVIQPLEHPAAE